MSCLDFSKILILVNSGNLGGGVMSYKKPSDDSTATESSEGLYICRIFFGSLPYKSFYDTLTF